MISSSFAAQRLPMQTLAIVDDDLRAAQVTGLQVEEAGFQPFVVEGKFRAVNDLAEFVSANAHGAVCDHRLMHRGLANFYGASLVAALYDLGKPAILVTQYSEIDSDVSIRMCRRKIPVLLSRDEADAATIRTGILECVAELSGAVPSSRKPHRTLVQLTDIFEESGKKVVDAIVPAWNLQVAVRFPAELVPTRLRRLLKPDAWMIAAVNIGARSSQELYFENFEEAPKPDKRDGLA